MILGPVASSPTDFQMIRHQVLPTNRNPVLFERAAINNPPPPVQQQQQQQHQPNLNRLQPQSSRNSFGESSSRRRDDANRSDNNSPNRSNNDDDVQNRLQRNLQMRSRRHDSDTFNLPKRFNESSIQAPYDRVAMAAFNVNIDNSSNSTTSPRERRLQSLRRMEEKIQAMRQINSPPDQIGDDAAIPQKRIKRNCIGLFVCDISNILLDVDPFIEWIEHKNFGHIANAPERLILSSLVAGNGELIMFGGLRKESLSKSSDTTIQVSNAIHFLRVPREII